MRFILDIREENKGVKSESRPYMYDFCEREQLLKDKVLGNPLTIEELSKVMKTGTNGDLSASLGYAMREVVNKGFYCARVDLIGETGEQALVELIISNAIYVFLDTYYSMMFEVNKQQTKQFDVLHNCYYKWDGVDSVAKYLHYINITLSNFSRREGTFRNLREFTIYESQNFFWLDLACSVINRATVWGRTEKSLEEYMYIIDTVNKSVEDVRNNYQQIGYTSLILDGKGIKKIKAVLKAKEREEKKFKKFLKSLEKHFDSEYSFADYLNTLPTETEVYVEGYDHEGSMGSSRLLVGADDYIHYNLCMKVRGEFKTYEGNVRIYDDNEIERQFRSQWAGCFATTKTDIFINGVRVAHVTEEGANVFDYPKKLYQELTKQKV